MEFPPVIESLPQMLEYVRGCLVNSNVKKSQLRDIELCCEEALVNIIMHGQAGKGAIEVECESNAHHFSATISDKGIPFNPIDIEIDPRVDRPLDERKVGGLGLYLIRRLASEISYTRKEHGNILKIVFRF
jgi:serine/threonine-protein kinase RsbW